MRAFVTGAAGFVGSHLVDRLLRNGHEVVGFDSFVTGRREFLIDALENPRFRLVEGDLLDRPALSRSLEGSNFVFHLAANADVRRGTEHPERDLEQNTIATWHVLEAMRERGVRSIAFASTGSVYGEPSTFPTPEDTPFPIQTSLYGASKLACEGLISAYCEGFGFQGWIYRFVSVLGERYSHGHVRDFLVKLRRDPTSIEVLGDGHQCKSYMYIQDCIEGILVGIEHGQDPVNIFNLGQDHAVEVSDSLGWITEELGLEPRVRFTGGLRGWVGDSPQILLDCQKIRSLGWKPEVSIHDAVRRTVRWLNAHSPLLDAP